MKEYLEFLLHTGENRYEVALGMFPRNKISKIFQICFIGTKLRLLEPLQMGVSLDNPPTDHQDDQDIKLSDCYTKT